MRLILLKLLARLPLRLLHFVGWLLGQTLWVVQARPAQIARRNLAACLPELDPARQQKLARLSLVETGRTLLESFVLWLAPANRVLGLVQETRGEEHLQQALAGERGGLLLVPHLGNWEMVGLYCSWHYPITSLYRPQRSVFFDQLILNGRGRFGAELVTTTTQGVRAAVRALKHNHLLGILPDQNPGAGAGVEVPFFGIRTNTPVLPARLAYQHACPVLCAWAERLPRGRGFILHFEPLDQAIAGADPEQAAATMNLELERVIRQKPEQYWWSHPRFRYRAQGEAEIYR